MSRRATVLFASLCFTACASEPLTMSLGSASTTCSVEVLGGGFVQWEARRVPRETMVLELRQRVRGLDAETKKSTRLEIALADDADETAIADRDWIIDQCGIMGIGQCKLQ